jgi:ribosomal protein L23
VKTVLSKGKPKVARTRTGVRVGKRADVKKAIVTLAAGQQIALM